MNAPSQAIVHTIDYGVTPEQIQAIHAEAAGLSCDTPAGYEQTRVAIAKCRTTRVTCTTAEGQRAIVYAVETVNHVASQLEAFGS